MIRRLGHLWRADVGTDEAHSIPNGVNGDIFANLEGIIVRIQYTLQGRLRSVYPKFGRMHFDDLGLLSDLQRDVCHGRVAHKHSQSDFCGGEALG